MTFDPVIHSSLFRSLSQIGTGQKNRSINTTLNVRNSRISQIALSGFMNERRRVTAATRHADEDSSNDDGNYHQQLKSQNGRMTEQS